MNLKHLSIINLAIILSCNLLIGQEWEYLGPTEFRNGTGSSWIDEYGNSYFNIYHTKLSEKGAEGIVSTHLLILDKNGKFNGIVKAKDCENRAPIFPFSNGNFLIIGRNCNKKGNEKPDARVLNKKGQVLEQGEGFTFLNSLPIQTKNGFTIFGKNSLRSADPTIEIRNINWDFTSSAKLLSLKKYKVPEKIVNFDYFHLPVQGIDNRWLVPATQGVPGEGNGVKPIWNFVFLTDGKKALRKFPKKRQDLMLEGLRPYQDGYALMMYSRNEGYLKKEIFLLDKNARLKKSINIELQGKPDNFLIINDRIIITNSIINREDKSRKFTLQTFDLEGQLIAERELYHFEKKGRAKTSFMEPFGDNSILLSGSLIPNKKDRRTFIRKLDLDVLLSENNSEDTNAQIEEKQNLIQEMTIEDLDEKIISVAAYPNPTSLYINFAVENSSLDSRNYHLDVFSMNGRKVYQADFSENFYELNVNQFVAGTYSYRIINNNDRQEYFAGKFIKVD